jgi:hypothetical protein
MHLIARDVVARSHLSLLMNPAKTSPWHELMAELKEENALQTSLLNSASRPLLLSAYQFIAARWEALSLRAARRRARSVRTRLISACERGVPQSIRMICAANHA